MIRCIACKSASCPFAGQALPGLPGQDRAHNQATPPGSLQAQERERRLRLYSVYAALNLPLFKQHQLTDSDLAKLWSALAPGPSQQGRCAIRCRPIIPYLQAS